MSHAETLNEIRNAIKQAQSVGHNTLDVEGIDDAAREFVVSELREAGYWVLVLPWKLMIRWPNPLCLLQSSEKVLPSR